MSELLLQDAHKQFESNSPDQAKQSAEQAFSKEYASNMNIVREKAPTQGSACIIDQSGYIDCGPIIGYPHPDVPPNPAHGTEPEKFKEVHKVQEGRPRWFN